MARRESTQKAMLELCDVNIKETYGMIPESVMQFDNNPELREIIGDHNCSLRNLGDQGKARRRGGGDAAKRNYSIFNNELCKFLYSYYFKEGWHILDPCMGKATRPVMALLNKMRYTGFEVCPDTIKYVRGRLSRFKKQDRQNITIHNKDGMSLAPLKKHSNHFDGILTCPPYWNVEQYSGKGNDISYCRTIDDYFDQIQKMMNNCYRLIKSSDYKANIFHSAIFVVGSVRDGKKGLIDLDFEFQRCAKNAGFTLHGKFMQKNLAVNKCTLAKLNYVKKYVSKSHETVLVFRKERH